MSVSLTELLETSSQAGGPGGIRLDCRQGQWLQECILFPFQHFVFISLPTSVRAGCKVGAASARTRFKCSAEPVCDLEGWAQWA